MFDHNSKLECQVHECHHRMNFKNAEVVGHEAHYHQRLFLEAWMSEKDPNAGNDHGHPRSLQVLSFKFSRAYSTRNVSTLLSTRLLRSYNEYIFFKRSNIFFGS